MRPPMTNRQPPSTTDQRSSAVTSKRRSQSLASNRRPPAISSSQHSLPPVDDLDSIPMDDTSFDQMEETTANTMVTKKNLTWTNDMDDYAIDLLIEQMHKGQKLGGSFTKTALIAVARTIGERFHLTCNSDHVTNRLKTLKKNFHAANDILRKGGGSGFGFNQSTQMIEANASVWATYLKAHPDSSPFRHKPIRNYDKLDLLVGKDRATGSLAAGPKERQLRWAREENISHVDDIGPLESHEHGSSSDHLESFADIGNLQTEPESSFIVGSTSTSKPTKESKEKKRTAVDIVREELKSIKAGMEAVAAALDRGNLRNFTEEQLLEEIVKVDGMSDMSHMKVYQALTEDVKSARAFLACSRERRELWLLVKYGPTFFDA